MVPLRNAKDGDTQSPYYVRVGRKSKWRVSLFPARSRHTCNEPPPLIARGNLYPPPSVNSNGATVRVVFGLRTEALRTARHSSHVGPYGSQKFVLLWPDYLLHYTIYKFGTDAPHKVGPDASTLENTGKRV